MSYESTNEAFGVLNGGLSARYEAGNPILLNMRGKPDLHIVSFKPVIYEEYSLFRNRAPYVVGSVVLRTFLVGQHPNAGAIIAYGVEAGNDGYGFYLNPCDPDSCQTVANIAKELGLPKVSLSAVS